VLRDEIYAVWAMFAGLVIGQEKFQSNMELLILFVIIITLRMLSVYYKWKLPRRSLKFKVMDDKGIEKQGGLS